MTKKSEALASMHTKLIEDYTKLVGTAPPPGTGMSVDGVPKPLSVPSKVVPRDEAHLKEFATLNRLHCVAVSYLRKFLVEKRMEYSV